MAATKTSPKAKQKAKAAPKKARASSGGGEPTAKRPRKSTKGSSAKSNKKLEQKSPAEFFAQNRTIAGFDNPGKSLYTTAREFIENSLDACEGIRVLPSIQVKIEEYTAEQFNNLIGLEATARQQHHLYADSQSKKKGRKGAASTTGSTTNFVEPASAVSSQTATQDVPMPEANGETQAAEKPKPVTAHKGQMFYSVEVTDNGSGMHYQDIPNMLGRVLSGTKYGVVQARGRFGLGAKMALIWAKMSTGQPIEVYSTRKEDDFTSHYKLDIDIYKNQPNIILAEKLPRQSEDQRGTTIKVIIEGSWTTYRARLLAYMRQIAVITPYTDFTFEFNTEDSAKNLLVHYKRRSEEIPRLPTEIMHHPSSVDLITLQKLISDAKGLHLKKFLTDRLSCINRDLAGAIIQELGDEFDEKKAVSSLSELQIQTIFKLFRELKFPPPDQNCLSPVGEYNLRLGVMKEMTPEMVATYQTGVSVYDGHPFQVEAAVSLGGPMKVGLNVFRFANRIPLLFEAGGDVVTQTVLNKIKWPTYKIRPTQDKVGIFVSIVSTKIPFKGTGKEYVGDDIKEISSEVAKAIKECAAQLRVKLVKKAALASRHERKNLIAKYIQPAAQSVFRVLERVAKDTEQNTSRPLPDIERVNAVAVPDQPEDSKEDVKPALSGIKKEEEKFSAGHMLLPLNDMILKTTKGDIAAETLIYKLTRYVEKSDALQAFEFATQKSSTKSTPQDWHLVPKHKVYHSYGLGLSNSGGTFYVMRSAMQGFGKMEENGGDDADTKDFALPNLA
eukprot:Clim_evm24s197 gene=Clim_evmTU24s197